MTAEVVDIDHGWAEAIESLVGLTSVAVTVGLRGRDGSDLVRYAAANEFGTRDGHVPERSFLRSTVDENRDRYASLLTVAARAALDGTRVETAFGRVGLVVTGDVQEQIRDLRMPPNAPSTIAKKGSDNPLIDSGRMRQSIDFEVIT